MNNIIIPKNEKRELKVSINDEDTSIDLSKVKTHVISDKLGIFEFSYELKNNMSSYILVNSMKIRSAQLSQVLSDKKVSEKLDCEGKMVSDPIEQ